MHNPSLRSQPRDQPAPILKSAVDSSILTWLEGTGRLMDREIAIDPALLEEDDFATELLASDGMEYDDDLDEDLDE